jgi:membrane-bound lytic murein transglycosylase B
MYKIMIRIFLTVLIIFAANVHSSVLDRSDVKDFLQYMVQEHGFDAAELNRIFERVEITDEVIKAISRPAEKLAWYQYRPIFLKQDRIVQGVKFWEENAAVLARAEAVYGVPAEIIVAIIGVETRYGRTTGRHKVINSLVTLAFDYPERSKFFTRELEQFLLLTREQDRDPDKTMGSYAGAMGIPQFISSSYRNYAVDFDRDGEIDIWDNSVDAVGSVGNYLRVHGWDPGKKIAQPAGTEGDAYQQLVTDGLQPDTRFGDLGKYGVTSDADLPADSMVKLLEFEAQDGYEYWLGLNNFYVISRYNHSMLYAMVVYQLAVEIYNGYTGK